jgi:hypothetical protein
MKMRWAVGNGIRLYCIRWDDDIDAALSAEFGIYEKGAAQYVL